jgi:signal transduction histidine kinase
MIDGNLNELSAEIGLYRMRADKNRAQKRSSIMQTILSVLALVVIGLLVTYNYVRRRSNEKLKQKNEELKEALNMAGEADRMKTEFVRRVSHEIRTPLNAISGFAEIICTPGMEIPDEDKADLIDRIQSNMRAITKIVDELLHVADSESQVSYPKNQTIACNQFLSAILESYRKEANANVELKYTPRVMNRFTIYSNESGLSKVVDNLVQNAVKFTSKGTIELRCEKSLDEQSVVITVTDTGKGIPEDKREKIFEQFYKVDAFQQGIGLGLTMSKQIAQKLGGDLVLDPEYTNGSRFVLTLPIE